MSRIEKLKEIGSKDRGFRYALPAMCLAAFHMIVAYAVSPLGDGFRHGDFIPMLFEGLIGIVLYAGLAVCVVKAIAHRRFLLLLDFIGLVVASRMLLDFIGRLGGAFIIAFVIIFLILGLLCIVSMGIMEGVMEALTPIVGPVASVMIVIYTILEYVMPVIGILMIVGMGISALTGVIGSLTSLGGLAKIFQGIFPLL